LTMVNLPSRLLDGVTGGTVVGLHAAIFIWLTFILTLGVAAYAVIRLIARNFSRNITEERIIMRGTSAGVGLGTASVLILLQLRYHAITYILAGVESGVAPVSLAAISSVLTMLIGVASWSNTRVPRYQKKSYVDPNKPVIGWSFDPTPWRSTVRRIKEIDWASKRQSAEPPEVQVVLGNYKEKLLLARVQFSKGGLIRFDRDALQARKNMEQWITLRLSLGPTTKSRLEKEVEAHFHNEFSNLFNSVLYEMIYRNEVIMAQEGQTVVLGLPVKERSPEAE
jgi:hypothetical protein